MNKLSFLSVTLTCLVIVVVGPAKAVDQRLQADKVIGPDGSDDSCSNCHVEEYAAWKETKHYKSWVTVVESDRAKEISDAMEERSIKRSQICTQCHFTSYMRDERPRAGWGPSCESCHGGAADWNRIHNRPAGDPAAAALKWGEGQKESAAARKARLDAAEKAGMLHSSMTYDIAANCFGCHTVPNEKVVNVGGHKAGSDFDLVAWSQGEVRHNYLSSKATPPNNPPSPPEQLRKLYVVGALVDLEFSLRNLSSATEPGKPFQTAMIARVNAARQKVDGILAKVEIPAISTALANVPKSVDGSTKIDAGLADKLAAATRKFADALPDLSAVDSMIPEETKGKPRNP